MRPAVTSSEVAFSSICQVSLTRKCLLLYINLQYLEDNKDKVYVDIDDMVTELQRKYRDYAKRKRPAFKGMVEKGNHFEM